MPEVLLHFLDGEVVRAKTELIDFHEAVILATSADPDSNNDEVTVPLSSLKYIVFGGGEEEPEAEDMGKVVIHFSDHEVLRAYAGRETLGGPYGVIYTLLDSAGKVRRRVGVPYTAVKAIFKVKEWDSRKIATRKPKARAKPAPKPKTALKPKPKPRPTPKVKAAPKPKAKAAPKPNPKAAPKPNPKAKPKTARR